MIAPGLIGEAHRGATCKPFTIGQIDPPRGFVHVLDDTSLDVVMRTLDTVSDFVSYLTKRERFILSGRLGMAAGEEDLLAYYLKYLNEDGEHDFVVPPGVNAIFIDEGLWGDFTHRPERRAQLAANRVSYAWDSLIEEFSMHILGGTQHYASHPEIREQEKIQRFLAREPRTRRRMLARSLLELLDKTPASTRAARVIKPSRVGDPYYVFLLLPDHYAASEAEYRDVRRGLLEAYCMVTKLKCPDAMDIVGIATETGTDDVRSEDAIYYDARQWTDAEEAEARSLQEDLGLLRETKQFAAVEYEYPEVPTSGNGSAHQPLGPRMKGRNRNAPCPCGSGKKFKKCCG